MDPITEEFRPRICVLFAQAVRDGEFSSKGKMFSSTVWKALGQLSKVLEAHSVEHPFKKGSVVDFEVDILMQGCRLSDLHPENQYLAVTPRFLRQVSSRAKMDKEKCMPLFLIIAFF